MNWVFPKRKIRKRDCCVLPICVDPSRPADRGVTLLIELFRSEGRSGFAWRITRAILDIGAASGELHVEGTDGGEAGLPERQFHDVSPLAAPPASLVLRQLEDREQCSTDVGPVT